MILKQIWPFLLHLYGKEKIPFKLEIGWCMTLHWWLSGKESACNAGDLGLIAGLGRSPGGGMATHSSILAWRILMGASLIAQLVKNPPVMQETLVQFLDQEDLLEKGEGIGYLLQYSWASLVAQLVKNLPAMQETWV